MGLKVGLVKLENYNSEWKNLFEKEKENLERIFGNIAIKIEHVGSTSIEGLAAKPIIDIMVCIEKFSDFENVREYFEQEPYSIKLDSPEDEILVRKGSEENRTHFIHIVENNTTRAVNTILFRDYLRKNKKVLNEYESLKKDLAKKYQNDRKSYTASKSEFIQNVIKKAKEFKGDKMKVGLVLEGGAMRGMYTAEVLDTFLDYNIKVDGIIGTSAGVLFGVNYPSKQKGRVIRYNKKYCKDKRYMGLYSLLTTGNVINKDFSFYEVPFKLDVFDDKEFNNSGIDFYATISNIETGEAEYVKLDSILNQMEVLRATSAMPFVSKIVEIDGKKYLDGGVVDAIPLNKCKELGYDKIIVVLTRVKEYRKKKSSDVLAKLIYKKYPKLIEAMNRKYQVYNDTVERIIDLENKKEIFVIRPSKYIDIKRIEKDEDKLQEMYDLGIEDTKKCLEDLKEYIEK